MRLGALILENGALDAYLLWEFLKDTVWGALERSPLDRDRILRSMGLAEGLIAGLSFDVKMKMVQLFSPFSQRVRLLEEKRWSLVDYPVSELGTVIPCVGDLPPEVIQESFISAVEYVSQNLQSDSMSVRYVRSLSRIADILEKIPVIVIEPGSEQRRLDEMIRVWGQRDWKIHETKGYIEDGNHRTLALALSNSERTSIRCCVGRPAHD